MNKDELLSAIANTNPCQRNWDHSQTIPTEDVNILLESVKKAPTKQNETNYKIYWTTDRAKIQEIYERTPYFAVYNVDGSTPIDENGDTPPEYCVTNPQVNANMIIAICDDWDQELARGRTHMVVDDNTIEEHLYTHIVKNRIMDIGVGIALGQICLTANLLGYRTGMCSAFNEDEVLGIPDTFCKSIIGIGYPQDGVNRRMHPDVLNSDIVDENMRTGELTDNWIFPTFVKMPDVTEM